jgi:FolB domain-containing protein
MPESGSTATRESEKTADLEQGALHDAAGLQKRSFCRIYEFLAAVLTTPPMDLIRIKGLQIDCIVGLRPQERDREQRIHIDLALGLDLAPAGRAGRIVLTCDYDTIAEEIISLLRFRRYTLIEMATEEVCAMLLGLHPPAELVEIHLDKPAALDGRARAASVEVRRDRSAFPITTMPHPAGTVSVLLETREAGLYRLSIEPGRELPGAFARGERELEWLVSGELWQGGERVRPGARLRAGGERAETYTNGGDTEAVLFRCVCPPLGSGG